MKKVCNVGVHTGRIVLQFDFETYDAVRARCPVPLGRRSWFLMERDGGILMERSAYGVAPHRAARTPDIVQLHADAETIVRCHTHRAKFEWGKRNQVFVPMPPHHLWPWMMDVKSRLKNMSTAQWRWHLVQEINARIRSATAAHVDLPQNLPEWVKGMLTRSEENMVLRNEELVR